MDIDQLNTFCTVAKFKSFRKAAEILKVTQPGISKRIQNLEAELGIALFDRTSHSVSLTQQGKHFLPFAERAMKIIDEGSKSLADMDIKEKLAIAATPTTSFNLLPHILKELRVNAAGASAQIYTAPSQQVYEMLLDQTIDIGLTTAIFPNPLIEYETIFTEEIVCVGHPDLAQHYLTGTRLTGLPLPMIVNHMETSPWGSINNYVRSSPNYEIVSEVQYIQVAERFAKLGLGFVLLPMSDAWSGLKSGELIQVTLPDLILPDRPVYMLKHRHRQTKDIVGVLERLIEKGSWKANMYDRV
ncbi:LysR family transcriptional regulator [Brevibacillus centrosporus]|uniref:LysR family transcriptional regulator n=1 Tax=Brevibacillus centrosporus TaxID=54910 RepID=UPI002E1B44CC|nr:LysR family transcriptional regulator [Brevibacillus centrosporus]